MPFNRKFCHRCGQQLNLSQVSNKAARPADKGKLLKEYFHRGYPYAAIVSLLEKRHGIRIHVRTLERKLNKKRPRKDCSPLFCRNFYVNLMPFIHYLQFYLRRQSHSNKLCKFTRKWKSTFISILLNMKLINMQHQIF